jgi:hypothetical protein
MWRAIVMDQRGQKPAVTATREFASESVDRLLDGWLDESAVERVVCVLPAGAAICRTCTLPNLDAEQLDQALHLQAEAHLLGIAPPHRLAVAPLDTALGETSRTGIILAWPPAAAFEAPTTTRPLTFAPVVAAMAGLIDGDRPTEPLIWMDRQDGSVALALSHANGVAFRATREKATDRLQWSTAIGRVLAETALNVGHTAGFTDALVTSLRSKLESPDSLDAQLVVPADVLDAARGRIDGTQADDRWWSQYGIAIGAAVATTGELEPLTTLLATEPTEEPSVVRTVLQVLARPSTAVTAVIALVLLLAVGPVAMNWLRLQVLHVRFGDLRTELAAINQMKHELSMYRELDRKVWPMNKLLGDIACNTPPGIELEFIRIYHGETFAVSGSATPQPEKTATEVVEQMMTNLGEADIFGEIALNWGEPTAYGRYDFDLSATIERPHHRPAYDVERDYALWTMQQRVDGETPDGVEVDDAAIAAASGEPGDDALASAASTGDGSSLPAMSPQNPPGSGDSEAADEDDGRDGRRVTPPSRTGRDVAGGLDSDRAGIEDMRSNSARSDPSKDIPDPLTPEQIEAMTKDEARAALTVVSKARRYNKEDEALQERLRTEFDLLLERLKKAP